MSQDLVEVLPADDDENPTLPGVFLPSAIVALAVRVHRRAERAQDMLAVDARIEVAALLAEILRITGEYLP